MSRNLDFGLSDRYFGRFSLARQISLLANPQRFGRTVDASNLANNLGFVKLVNEPSGIALPASAAAHQPVLLRASRFAAH
jgi:hypothetical protein